MAKHKKRLNVIIAGSREFNNKRLLFNMAGWWYGTLPSVPEITVVSGMARGADTLGKDWADFMGFPTDPYPVTEKDWYPDGRTGKMNKRAGILRNVEMAKVGDVLLAFWDGQSKGTKHMIDEALRRGLEVHVWQDWARPLTRGQKHR